MADNNLAYTYSQIHQPDLAIALFKVAVNSYQNQREQISRIGASEFRSYTGKVAFAYQNLAAELVKQDRLPEAQMVLDMLKEHEQFQFVRGSAVADQQRIRIGYNTDEKVLLERYRLVSGRLGTLKSEQQALQKQAKLGLNTAQKERQRLMAKDLRLAQKDFDSFFYAMRIKFARTGQPRKADLSDLNEQTVKRLQHLIGGLGHDAVLLQYYVTEDQVGMLLTTPSVQLARSAYSGDRDR